MNYFGCFVDLEVHKIDPRVMCKGEEAICSPFFAGAVVSEVALLCRIYLFPSDLFVNCAHGLLCEGVG